MNNYTGKRLFGSWYIRDFNRPLGKGSFGTVYELRSYNSIIDPTAVKIISIPNSWQEYRSLLGAVGADERSVNAKLTQAKDRLINEIAIMLKVSGHSNCVSCMAYDVVPHEDCFGWDVLIQMEKLETLDAYYRRKGTITNFDIVRLGMDMCSALDICAENNIAHRDIKPANIMVKEVGKRVYYKLADFGVAGILRGSGTMTITGTIEYMAPELFRGEGDARVDIYSLGIVLYELLNANRLPFLPDYPAAYTDNDVGLARAKRLKGERPPEPLYAAGTELGKTIVKACEYRPEDRFKNAKEMYGALKEALSKGEKRAIFSVPAVGPYLPTQREERKRRAAENEDTRPAGRAQGRHTARESIRSDKALTDNVAKAQNAAAKLQTGRHEKLYTEPKQAAAKSAAKQAEKRAKRRKALWIAVPAALCVIAISIVGVLAARQSGWIGAAREKETQTEAVPVTSSAAEEIAAAEIPDGLQYKIENGSAVILGYTGSAKEIELPNEIDGVSVTRIEEYAFFYCTSLTSVTIPEGVTTIGDGAFYDCTSLTSVTIPEGVTTIGDGAFYDCESLTSVTIPEGVTKIGDSAFYDCESLTSVTIPEGVTKIGDAAFSYCDSLTSVTIFEGVTTIGDWAFSNCDSLTSVTILEGVTKIGDSAFYNCESLTSVTIPSSVTTIGDCAFFCCTRLTSVTIPEGVTTIGYGTFSGCKSLTLVTIPEGVTTIGDYAFYDCDSLTSVTVPSSVTSIGEYAFDEATAVQYEGSSPQQNAATITPTSSQTPSAADIDAIGDSITYPKEASYLSEYKTMYIAIEGNGSIAYVFSKSNGTWAYLIEDLCVYEDNEVTVIAEENDHSCIIFYGDDGKQHAGWVNSDYVAEEKIEE